MNAAPPSAQFVRLGETDRAPLNLSIDGKVIEALEGDTLLTAILVNNRWLRSSEFGDGVRAGFCLMGACQDCLVWTQGGERLRACSTPAEANMRIFTTLADRTWPCPA